MPARTSQLGEASNVIFDGSKESCHTFSRTEREADNFRILGIPFGGKLLMHAAVRETICEASWRVKTLLMTHRYFTKNELVVLFKSHVLSYVEYRSAGISYAATSAIAPLDNVLVKFLEEIGLSSEAGFIDIGMLGVIHRAVLDRGPRALQLLFQPGTAPERLGGRPWHSRHVDDPHSVFRQYYLARSLVGYTWVYNLLPEMIISVTDISKFQSACQTMAKKRIPVNDWKESFSPKGIPSASPTSLSGVATPARRLECVIYPI